MNLLHWNLGRTTLSLGDTTLIMGVVNVTPDSFSDGGHFFDPEKGIAHGRRLAEQGADILDIGGESTRPGSDPVPAEEETNRVIPVVRELRRHLPDILLSVDTSKAAVAAQAIEAGADIINDVTAGHGDPAMIPLLAGSKVGLAIMHMQGTPKSMQHEPRYDDVVQDVIRFLQERIKVFAQAGVDPERIVVDPGIGFGKTLEHNLALLAGLREFTMLERPLLLGVSRKRWIGELTGRPVDQRLAGSLAGAAACVERGAHLLRVHDVAETRDLVRVLDRIRSEREAK
jgi:dihydropteroate synthase